MHVRRSLVTAFAATFLLSACADPHIVSKDGGLEDAGDAATDAMADATSDATSDAADDAATDAMTDAAVGCTPPTADYVELHDATNDTRVSGTEESTGLTANAQSSVTIGGCIDSTYAAGAFRDSDSFGVHVGGTGEWLTVRLERTLGAAPAGDFLITITTPDGDIDVGAFTGSGGSGAGIMTAPVLVPPGDYRVNVRDDAASAGGSYPYKLTIWTFVCGAPMTSYTEAQDGASNRGNDFLAVDLTSASPYSLTPAADAPESATGIPVVNGATVQIYGNSANIATAGDSYRDRDSYRLVAGTSVGAIVMQATWATANNDLDVLFATDTLGQPVSLNFAHDTNQKTWLGLPVVPQTQTSILWIGNSNDSGNTGTNYTLTVCAVPQTPP